MKPRSAAAALAGLSLASLAPPARLAQHVAQEDGALHAHGHALPVHRVEAARRVAQHRQPIRQVHLRTTIGRYLALFPRPGFEGRIGRTA